MPEGVRGSRDYFKERFGLGDRLAVRLAALLSRQVALTAASVECLKDSPAFRHVILHPRLLEDAEELDTERLHSYSGAGEELPASFVVTEEDGWRVIALEEELLAEESEAQEVEDQLPVLTGKSELLHPTEIGELFSRRDIAELELTLRTSADANEKITAIRRLALSPASEREKLSLFAMALTDRSAEVRGEAAEALTTLGLSADVAEDARALAEGNEEQKRFAVERIGQRILEAEDAEMGVLLRIIAGTLRHEPSTAIRRRLVESLVGACRSVARDSRSSRDLVRILIGQLRDAAEELGAAVRSVLLALGRHNREQLYHQLQEELAAIRARPVRRLLVAVAGEIAPDEEQWVQVCRQAVAEINASEDPTGECLPLANLLGKSGRHAVDAIAETLAEAPEASQTAFVRLLDVIGTRQDTSTRLRARVGRLMLDALRQGERAARLAVIQSTALMNRDIPAKTRGALAGELIGCLAEYANPGIVDAIEATVVNLGAPAVEPLLDAMERAERPRQRVSAARALGDLVARLDGRSARTAHEAIERSLRLADDSFPDRPELVRALGRMCSGSAASEADVARVAEMLRAAILDKPIAHAALDGLSHLCLSPKASRKLKVDLVDFFARILERDLPDIEATTYAADVDETGYAFGGDVLAYTELVPSVIQGLRHIATSSGGVLREQALGHLLAAWRQIASGELQVGPGNTEQLLEALRAIGTLPDIEAGQREAIADALALRKDFLPTYRALAELVVAAGEPMADRAAALADEVLRREAAEDELTPSERGLLLGSLVRLAAAADLGTDAERLRQRIVAAVTDAEKRDLEAAPGLVEELRESPAISDSLKKRLPRRPRTR
jgi:hypothetical protein